MEKQKVFLKDQSEYFKWIHSLRENGVKAKEISKEEVKMLRFSSKFACVFKLDGKFYWMSTSSELYKQARSLMHSVHKCGDSCSHCYAKHVEDGGCEKILFGNSHIEMYDWITVGFETNSQFCIGECLRYEKAVPRKITKA